MQLLHHKYLVASPEDRNWGLIVSCVGTQAIAPGEQYPPAGHPSSHLFNPQRGRVLDEYQLVYITQGRGMFRTESGDEFEINEGDMFLLFPGKWHSYSPLAETGWTEYWIGFNGGIASQWQAQGFISSDRQLNHVGIRGDIIELFREAMTVADRQESGYQQMLCGIACHIISACLYYEKNIAYREDKVLEIIGSARAFISKNVNTVTPKSVADKVNVGYSKMRKLFKTYTGLSLGQYILQVRTNKAKNLLCETNMSIAEIASELGYDNEEYFSTSFKRITGEKPTGYRKKMTKKI